MPDTDAWILVPPQLEWEQPTSAPACARRAALDFQQRYPPVPAEDWLAASSDNVTAGSWPPPSSPDSHMSPRRLPSETIDSPQGLQPCSRINRPQTPLVPPTFTTATNLSGGRLDDLWRLVDTRSTAYPPFAAPPPPSPTSKATYPPSLPDSSPLLPDASTLLPIFTKWRRPSGDAQPIFGRAIIFDDSREERQGERSERPHDSQHRFQPTYPALQLPPPTIPAYRPFTHPYFAPTPPPPEDPYEGYARLSDGEDEDAGGPNLTAPVLPSADAFASATQVPTATSSLPAIGEYVSRASQTGPMACDACGASAPGNAQWACTVCTLHNAAGAPRCVACLAPPPHATAPNASRLVQQAQAEGLHEAQLHRRPSRGDHAAI